MTKVGFVSLGCVKNLTDTEVMLRKLHDAGFEITPDESEAEIIVVNTCGFIESAKQESIDNILDVAWLKKNGKCKHIIATGCLVERYREEVMKEMPEVDALIGVGSLVDIAEACKAVQRGEKYTSFRDKNTSSLNEERLLTTPEHTAYLKIAEGCDNLCTYCAIPSIRGKFRSRRIEDIVKEAKDLAGQVRAIYEFLEEINLAERLDALAQELDGAGDNRSAQILNQLWEILLGAMEQLHDVLGGTVWNADNFVRLFKLLLSQYNVGTIPPVLDAVQAGQASAMRCHQQKHLILLGGQV